MFVIQPAKGDECRVIAVGLNDKVQSMKRNGAYGALNYETEADRGWVNASVVSLLFFLAFWRFSLPYLCSLIFIAFFLRFVRVMC